MSLLNKERSKEDLLVLEAQNGCTQAFEALYRYYNKPLLRFAYRLSGDDALAHDAVQEAWITLGKALSKLGDPRGFRAWAYKTVRWRVTDQARKRGPTGESLETQIDSPAPEKHSEDATPDQLRALLNQLPPDDRHTLTLFYLGELHLTEISAVLDIPVGTVKSRLNRARNSLRKKLAGEMI